MKNEFSPKPNKLIIEEHYSSHIESVLQFNNVDLLGEVLEEPSNEEADDSFFDNWLFSPDSLQLAENDFCFEDFYKNQEISSLNPEMSLPTVEPESSFDLLDTDTTMCLNQYREDINSSLEIKPYLDAEYGQRDFYEPQVTEIMTIVVEKLKLPELVEAALADYIQTEEPEVIAAIQTDLERFVSSFVRLNELHIKDAGDCEEALMIRQLLEVWYDELLMKIGIENDEVFRRQFFDSIASTSRTKNETEEELIFQDIGTREFKQGSFVLRCLSGTLRQSIDTLDLARFMVLHATSTLKLVSCPMSINEYNI